MFFNLEPEDIIFVIHFDEFNHGKVIQRGHKVLTVNKKKDLIITEDNKRFSLITAFSTDWKRKERIVFFQKGEKNEPTGSEI